MSDHLQSVCIMLHLAQGVAGVVRVGIGFRV